MIKLLMFDLDGTLADTLPSIHHAVELAMEHFGFRVPTIKQTEAALGSGARELFKRLVPAEVSSDDEKLDEFLEYYNEMYAKTYMDVECCYEGMAEAVIELKKRGYTIAVLSNKQDNYVVDIVGKLFEKGIVTMVQGQTELPTKPDPTVPLLMATSLGFEPFEVAFIGDSDVDVKTGKNSGFVSVACAWGFRSREQLEALSPDYLIARPEELLDIFK